MSKNARGRISSVLAVAALCVVAACGGGDDGTDKDSPPSAPAPLTLDDLKPSADFSSRQIIDPVTANLGLPDDSWDDIASSLGNSLEQMIKASLTDPTVWASSSDEEAFRLVYGSYSALGDLADGFAKKIYSSVKGGLDDDRQRIGPRVGSVFPAGTTPAETFVFKLKYDASVDGDTLTLRAVVWAGYDVGGEQPVLVARQFGLTGQKAGTDIGYGAKEPVGGGFYDTCSAVVDGVLKPKEDRMDAAELDALRAEFEDPDYRPLEDALQTVADAGGADGDVTVNSTENAAECLAGATATP